MGTEQTSRPVATRAVFAKRTVPFLGVLSAIRKPGTLALVNWRNISARLRILPGFERDGQLSSYSRSYLGWTVEVQREKATSERESLIPALFQVRYQMHDLLDIGHTIEPPTSSCEGVFCSHTEVCADHDISRPVTALATSNLNNFGGIEGIEAVAAVSSNNHYAMARYCIHRCECSPIDPQRPCKVEQTSH